MLTQNPILLFIAFFLFNLPLNIYCSNTIPINSTNIVETTCAQTINPNLCVSTLNSLSNITAKADQPRLAQIMIQKAQAMATSNLGWIQQIMNNQTNIDDLLLNDLDHCFDLYEDAAFNWLKSAYNQIKNQKDFVAASESVIFAFENGVLCYRLILGRTLPAVQNIDLVFQDMSQIAAEILLPLAYPIV